MPILQSTILNTPELYTKNVGSKLVCPSIHLVSVIETISHPAKDTVANLNPTNQTREAVNFIVPSV